MIKILAHENIHFSNGNYETKSSRLANEMRNTERYLKGATII